MTTEHQDDQRRSGGFREAVNELFGRNEHDSRDTSQLDALDRDEARRHGDPVQLVASSERIGAELGWQPERAAIEEIVESA